MPVLEMAKGSLPYSNEGLPEHSQTGYHKQERTMWSVGMIIFEIFAGGEFIQSFTHQDDVQEGLIFIQNELGNRLQSLLRGLLFEVRFEAITKILDEGILDDADRVGKAIRAVCRRISGSNYLEQRLRERES